MVSNVSWGWPSAPFCSQIGRARCAWNSAPAQGGDGLEGNVIDWFRWVICAKANIGRANTWMNWNSVSSQAEIIGLVSVVGAVENQSLNWSEIQPASEVSYDRWWIDRVVTEDAVLCSFIAEQHEEMIRRFQELDAQVSKLSQAILKSKIDERLPDPNAFGTDPEWGTLAREISKKARHLPLRQLFQRIPHALTQLAPCLMMSPLSIRNM